MSNEKTPSGQNFRPIDALEVKADFILGVPLEELAERMAIKRGKTVQQAMNYLIIVRGRDGWIAEREAHLNAVNAMAQKKVALDRSTALAAEQSAVADRLVQLGVNELTTTRALTRKDALETLKLGYQFHYRAIGQPDHVIDPALVQKPGEAASMNARASELQGMDKGDALVFIKGLIERQQGERAPANDEDGAEEE